jgi:prepilin-type processing-associated H-X9-DG protein
MQCSNNLKQIGLAMHMHHESKGVFPMGHYWSGDYANGSDATWITYLLPYLEQQGLYENIDWTGGLGQTTSDAAICKTPIPTFICPSNDPFGLVDNGFFARGTYAANNGIGPMEDCTTTPNNRMAGVFFLNSKTRAADVADGLSNTVFVAEIIAVSGEDFRGVLHYPEGPLYHHNYTPNSPVPDEIRENKCVSTTNAPCDGSLFQWWNPRKLTMTARSNHGGGVNVLLGDGSSCFLSDNLTLDIWQALATPKGGEIPKNY